MTVCGRAVAVVDDDLGVLDSMRFLLEIEGHQVATYDSAAAFLQGEPVPACCLVIDQHMPRMTGLELAGILRARGDKRRIMLITAAPNPAIHKRAEALRIRVLEKPPAPDEVLAFVGEPH